MKFLLAPPPPPPKKKSFFFFWQIESCMSTLHFQLAWFKWLAKFCYFLIFQNACLNLTFYLPRAIGKYLCSTLISSCFVCSAPEGWWAASKWCPPGSPGVRPPGQTGAAGRQEHPALQGTHSNTSASPAWQSRVGVVTLVFKMEKRSYLIILYNREVMCTHTSKNSNATRLWSIIFIQS